MNAAKKFEYKTEAFQPSMFYGTWIGEPPPMRSPEQILEDAAEEGWEFCGLTPSNNHPVSEHRSPELYMFKREKT